jgi:hypothetical protein
LRFSSVHRSPLYPLLSSPPVLPYTIQPLPLCSPSPVHCLRSSTHRLTCSSPLHLPDTMHSPIRSLYLLATTTPLSLSSPSLPVSLTPSLAYSSLFPSPLPPAPSATAHPSLLPSLAPSPYLVLLANLTLPRNSTATPLRASSRSRHPGPRPRAQSGRTTHAISNLYEAVSRAGEFFSYFASFLPSAAMDRTLLHGRLTLRRLHALRHTQNPLSAVSRPCTV